jgi:hypothetical protein
MNIELVVGLPGSGKDWFVAKRLEKEKYENYLVINDMGKKNYGVFIEALSNRMDMIIADPYLCLPICRDLYIRSLKKAQPDDIKWIFFDKNSSQCYRNTKDKCKSTHKLIDMLSKYYQIPHGYKPIPIYGGEGNEEVMREAENSFLVEGESEEDIEVIRDHYNPYLDEPIHKVVDKGLAQLVGEEDKYLYK